MKFSKRAEYGKFQSGVGFIDEWHVDLRNSFHHFGFDDVPWFSEEGEVLGSAFQ